jgi:hypothetical protein
MFSPGLGPMFNWPTYSIPISVVGLHGSDVGLVSDVCEMVATRLFASKLYTCVCILMNIYKVDAQQCGIYSYIHNTHIIICICLHVQNFIYTKSSIQ